PVFGTGGFELFVIIGILFCLSLVPVSLADNSSPQAPEAFSFNLKAVWLISPIACIGCLTLGLTNSSFRLIGPLYAERMGLDTAGVAIFVAANIVGGALLQYPLGYMSDRYDRRWLVVVATLGAAFAGIFLTTVGPGTPMLIYAGSFLFGAFAIPLYSLSIAHANDRAKDSQYVLVAAGLLFVYSIGASVGPFLSSVVISTFGAPAFFAYTSIVHIVLVAATLARMAVAPRVPGKRRSVFAGLLRTSPAIARMAQSKRPKSAKS
ncbi:MAG: MFS transporter, partial [Hyphomicrobiales bacterium]